MVKLIENISSEDITSKKIRTTSSGSKIVDLDCDLIQIGWCKVLFDVDYSICIELDYKMKESFEKLDSLIKDIIIKNMNFTEEETNDFYKKLSNNSSVVYLPLSKNIIMFNESKDFFDKTEIKNMLKPGNYIRTIFKIKKITFVDYIITSNIETIQLEIA